MNNNLTYNEKQKILRYAVYKDGILDTETKYEQHSRYVADLLRADGFTATIRVFTLNQSTNLYN